MSQLKNRINDKYWFSFCKAHPEVADCFANRSVMEDYAESSGLMLDGFSADTYEYILAQIPDRLAAPGNKRLTKIRPTGNKGGFFSQTV